MHLSEDILGNPRPIQLVPIQILEPMKTIAARFFTILINMYLFMEIIIIQVSLQALGEIFNMRSINANSGDIIHIGAGTIQ